MKFRRGDLVKITSGKDKGKEGKIEKIMPKKGTVLVPGVNIYKKHVKPAMTVDGKGGIFEFARALPLAKIALICPNCKKVTRVGFRIEKSSKAGSASGRKSRICRKCGKVIKYE